MSTETVAAAMGFSAPLAHALENACIRFGITTTLQKAHFLAQVAHESGAGRWLEEIWGPTPSQLRYEGRKDLGNTERGDGVRFKGRGAIQLTGRANYRDYSRALYGDDRCIAAPEMLAALPDAALAAGWFWQTKGLNPMADRDDVVQVTRRINGGTNGLADRVRRLDQAKRLFVSLTDRP